MSPVRHAIFDLDGTLVDSLPGIAWSIEAALSACALPPRSCDLKGLIGPPIRSILATVSGVSEPAGLDRLEEAFRASYDSAGWRRTSCRDGAVDLLRLLACSGIGLWVVTNKPGEVTAKILRELKIASFFQEAACRDARTPPYRSKAEVLAALLLRRSLTPAECLMVGDTLEDCRAAAAVGIACAVVPHGYGDSLENSLPARCRRIAGWDDVAAWCAALQEVGT